MKQPHTLQVYMEWALGTPEWGMVRMGYSWIPDSSMVSYWLICKLIVRYGDVLSTMRAPQLPHRGCPDFHTLNTSHPGISSHQLAPQF